MSLNKTEYQYAPIIKSKGFNPSPVAGRIPFWADSERNPDCIGTKNWEEFWLEQIYYCLNGYTTGGIWIPPVYYFHLNFDIIKGLHGSLYPHYVDVHYDVFREVDHIKKTDGLTGIILPKARRKGLSIVGNAHGSYGMRFITDYRMGVAAGLERYTDGFRIKLYAMFNNVPPELKINLLRQNDSELQLGYEEKNVHNQFEEKIISLITFATLKDKATKLEGEFFHDVIMEECGEFELLDKAYESIRPALEIGEKTLGTFFFYGTGGNMLKGSKAFKDLWHNAESYGLVKMFIGGHRYYFPYYGGAKDENGIVQEKIPNILAKYPELSPEQYLGCEDTEAAKEQILSVRIQRAKNPNKKALMEWNQKYPLTVDEVFSSSGVNNFNSEKLYSQQFSIDAQPRKYAEYILEFKKDKDGKYIVPLEVTARPAKKTDPEWERVEILEGGHPNKDVRDLDVGGLDGYNEDQTQTSQSLGGIVVIRRYDEFRVPGAYYDQKVPVCHYMRRPPRKELFWEIGLKIAVYYNLRKNMMISAESDMVINFFKENFGKRFLSPRPKEFDAPDGKQMHDWGVKMTTYSKPRMISLLQTYVEDAIHVCYFDNLIRNFLAYDYENIGTDWDDVDAIGYALMRIVDMKRVPVKESTQMEKNDDLDLPSYVMRNGILVKDEESSDYDEMDERELLIQHYNKRR